MDVNEILTELRQEQQQIDDAILALERLLSGQGKRRGRPPKWMEAVREAPPKRRGRPPGSKKKAQSE